ncbi:hypothetical protein BKA69DRAFT_1101670 [Paraphysoderma sedebokerense]|nr:hypothetical protein BKA69DRAFT_1101670 [Paraphysoderma sedebokerense]
MMLFVCFISYVFYHDYKPYTYESLNKLESLSSVCSAAILGIGLLLFTDQFSYEDQRLVLTAILLTVMALFIVAAAVAVVYEFSNAMKNKSTNSGKVEKRPKKNMVTHTPSRVQLMGNEV